MNILVTGGTGSIGRLVCKKLKSLGQSPVVFSRDPGRQIIYCPDMTHVAGDITDVHDISCTINRYNINAVIHTACIKHVTYCESHPAAAVNSVINGTINVLKAIEANARNIKRAIFISSDKACQKEQIYGMCKYISEKIVQEYACRISTKLNSIRFGNVFGSQGSVLPIWLDSIKRDKDINVRLFNGNAGLRYVMLPSQAQKLIIEVFNEPDMYNSGTVIAPIKLPLMNMYTAASAILELIPGKSRIRGVSSQTGESFLEQLYTEEELLQAIKVGNLYEITGTPLRKNAKGMLDEDPQQMDLDETKAFIVQTIKELTDGP